MTGRSILTDEEIEQILSNVQSDDEDAIDQLFQETDDESDPEYEPGSDDLLDDDELNEKIAEAENRSQKRKASRSSSKNQRKSSRGNNSNPQDQQQPSTSHTHRSASLVKELPTNNRYLTTWNTNVIIGKNGYTWQTQSVKESGSKTRAKNIVHVSPGPTNNARSAETPLQCFQVFFTEDMLDRVVECTNREIESLKSKYKAQTSTLSTLTKEELLGLFASLYYAAAMKNNHLHSEILHNTVLCGDKHNAIMSEARFKFLIRCLRFDDRDTREDRGTKLAPISELWDDFVNNCKNNYKPGSYLTIDEQLVGFRGRCPFRMYIPSKPNKYGMKIIMICDNSTKFMINAIPYLGKGSNPTSEPAGTYYTTKLVESASGVNRNLTMDNWFTSVPLAEKLLKEHKITVIGTIRKDKKELPADFVNLKFQDRKANSSLFLFSENVTAVSYKATEKKLATLISTLHDDAAIHPGSGKPEIIMNYNETKGGVDVLDRLCQDTNTGRKTKRWPMAFFYNMLNIGAVNSFVVFLHNFHRTHRSVDGSSSKAPSRFKFMMQLVDDLSKPWMAHRLTLRIPASLRSSIQRCLGSDATCDAAPTAVDEQEGPKSRVYCAFCHYKKRRKTSYKCVGCNRGICGEHTISTRKCLECNGTDN